MFRPLEHSASHDEIIEQLNALIVFDDLSLLGRISSLANASALLTYYLTDINWLGFYLLDDHSEPQRLVLGPFQGAPACVSISHGKGVCGTAWAENRTMVVPDVQQFPGHIACDAASRSEVVVPLVTISGVVGVLDIDSPLLDRFSAEDVALFERVARTVSAIFRKDNERSTRGESLLGEVFS